MKITKLGHCCLLIETKGKRILTDPGSYTINTHSNLENIDCILYTHDHQDHFHLESLKAIIHKNPQIIIYANDSVSGLLEKENIRHIKLVHNDNVSLGTILIVGLGEKHAEMHSSIPQISNLGFFIDSKLWYPGDAFTNPERSVEILTLPVSGPWMKIGEAVDYALSIKPKVVIPVHDGTRFGSSHLIPAKVLSENGIEFVPMIENDIREF